MISRAGWLVFAALAGCAPTMPAGDAGTARDAAVSPLVGRWVSTRVVPLVVPYTTWTLTIDATLTATLDVAILESCNEQSTSHERFVIRRAETGSDTYRIESIEACAPRSAPCPGVARPCDRARLAFPLNDAIAAFVGEGSGLLTIATADASVTFRSSP